MSYSWTLGERQTVGQRWADFLSGQPRVTTEILSILGGTNAGAVWSVGSLPDVSTALVYSRGQGSFYVVGNVDLAWLQSALVFAASEVMPLSGQDSTVLEVSAHNDSWERALAQQWTGKEAAVSRQWVYRMPLGWKNSFGGPVSQKSSNRPHELRLISQELLVDQTVDTVWLQNILSEWWPDLDGFFEHGAGWTAIADQEAVSACYSSFAAAERRWTLGVDTQSSHRRLGLAQAVGQMMLQTAVDRAAAVEWDCMEGNTASRRLADALGLQAVAVYSIWDLPI